MRSKLTEAVAAWPWVTASAAEMVNAASIRLSVKMTAEAEQGDPAREPCHGPGQGHHPEREQHVQPLADLGVGQSLGDQVDHGLLAGGEALPAACARRCVTWRPRRIPFCRNAARLGPGEAACGV